MLCSKMPAGLKQNLTHAPLLRLPDPRRRLEVIADASGFELGGNRDLMQEGHPIAFERRKMSPAEKDYDVGTVF